MENKNQALQTSEAGALTTVSVTAEQRTLIKSTIMFPNASDDETALFIFNCQRIGVHPLDKMIHPIKFQGDDPKMIFINSIDLFRSMAEETGEYDGQDEAEFEWDEEKNPEHTDHPILARVRIYRKGMERPIIGVARWSEFYPGDGKRGNIWRKMQCNQLAKCAEAQAFRKAFPKKFHEFYIAEEMDQSQVDPREQRKDRSASVKPAQPAGKVIDADQEEITTTESIDDEITQLLNELTDNTGDYKELSAMFKRASYRKVNGKDFSDKLDNLSSVVMKVKKELILPRLRNWKGKADALKAETDQSGEPGPANEEQPPQGDGGQL